MSPIASLLLLLPVLASAGPLLTRQAGQVATILSVTSDGPACPPGSLSTAISSDGTKVTAIFDKFRTEYQSTTGVAPEKRDLFCNIQWTLKFPIGCTRANFVTQTRGYPLITEGGVTGNYFPSYGLSPGNFPQGNSLPPTTFDTTVGDASWLREESPSADVQIRNENERNVRFEARTRLSIQPVSDKLAGVVYVDSIDLTIANQRAC